MLKTVDEIQVQVTTNLQSLLSDILLAANDARPLMIGDEQEFKTIKGVPFPAETNVFAVPFQGPRRNDFPARLLPGDEGKELSTGRKAGLLLKLPLGRIEGVFSGVVLSLGDRPCPFVLLGPEGPSRVDSDGRVWKGGRDSEISVFKGAGKG